MRKPDAVEAALSRLSALKKSGDPAAAIPELRAALAARVNFVVARAARIAAELQAAALVPALAAAFDRLMANPRKLDKGCAALTEIAAALYALDYLEPEPYLAGIRHRQLEPAFGEPVDAARKLRAQCALALVRTRHPDALAEVVGLLVDPEPQARIGGARALGLLGSETAELLLRLKILAGDEDIDVVAECLLGVAALKTERALSFVARFLDSADPAIGEAAALALGESRDARAVELLIRQYTSSPEPLRKTLLVALAIARLDLAIDFLISQLRSGSADALSALAMYKDDERVRGRVEPAVAASGDPALLKALREWA
ncbi:MAG: HEAT repeat domain-containing protein [Bryobacteraceae bacterium]